ncbi:MAG TPA: type IV pilus secretin PilQ [Burkholderiales bacterium]|nr:type IV pilus secretin PilQ [Burkholderiales bacterium]
MKTNKSIYAALYGISLWLAGIGAALAQANSIEAFDVTQQRGNVIVRITTKEPLKSVPPNFAVANPARIALDFPNTVNALGRANQSIDQGGLRSMNVVQGANRTRVVLNLERPVAHETTLDGRTVVINLAAPAVAQSGGTAGPVAHFAEGRGDAQHQIRDVDFRRGKAGEGRIVVDLSDPNTGIDIRQQGQNIIVEFAKTALPDNLRRRLDVVDFATPVNSVSTFQQGENVRMVIEPKGQWEHNAYQSDSQFVVEVKPLATDGRATQRDRYTGEKLSLNFQNVEVRAVLNVIADFTDLNIITSDTVAGNITLRLKDVPWDQALDIILQTRGLDSRRSGNVIWIAPRDELATREKLALEAQQQINDLEQTRTESFVMNYQKAQDVQKLLSDPAQRLLSKRGSAVVDQRTNTLFVQDTPSRLEEVRKLLAKIDIPVRQVMIEARIVEANDSFSKNLGARLGYNDLSAGRSFGGPAGPRVAFGPGSLETRASVAAGGVQSGVAAGAATTPSVTDTLGANLPAAGVNGFNAGQFSFILFNAAATRFLNVEISALEADGKGKIISSPRVLTADQVEALIEQGTSIPYQQATSSGATAVQFQKANLALKVKPQITPDGNVIMDLDVNNDSVGAATATGLAINTKHVKTQVLVENGGTVVIGGIYQQSDRTDITRVPVLGELPYIGFLFRNNTSSTSKTELLVFITPRVVNDRLTIR